jgi:CHAD domain-containing protein
MLHGAQSGDVRAVHQMRVASRRLRELLPILQIDAVTGQKLEHHLRKVTRLLGTLRELDVMATLIGELRARDSSDHVALDRLADLVADARARALGRLGGKVWKQLGRLSDKLGRVAVQLNAPESRLPQRRGWRWALDARIAHRAERLDATLRAAGAVYLPERLHAVRIATKKLRYAVELSVEAAGGRTSADLRTLKRSQQVLGRMHDLQVLIDFVRSVQARLKSPELAVRRSSDDIVRGLENSCRRLHARHLRERPALRAVLEHLNARPAVDARATARRAG